MAQWAWVLAACIALLAAGCLGAGSPDGEDEAPRDLDEPAEPASDPTGDTGDAGESNEAPEPASADPACEGLRANLTDLLETRREDPFGDRDPLEPGLRDCSGGGAFLLVAHGLEGTDLVQPAFSFERSTDCEGTRGIAATGGAFRYYLAGWDGPDGTSTASSGSGGAGLGVFAGPADTRELLAGGSTSWGSAIGGTFEQGQHRYTVAANHWGAYDSSLTEGAAFLLALVCEEPFAFDGLGSSSLVDLFRDQDMDDGVGASAPFVPGGSAGRALDRELETAATLRLFGHAAQGAGAVEVDHADDTERHTIPPGDTLVLTSSLPEGPVTVSLADAGRFTSVVGLVHGPIEPVDSDEVVGEAGG